VVPFRDAQGRPAGVLDVDSTRPAAFDEVDREHLEAIVRLVFGG
jgi:putative methionine-R-sulfoxide reductase with GAF domain